MPRYGCSDKPSESMPTLDWLSFVADACDADAACAGFDGGGRLRASVDMAACSIGATADINAAERAPGEGWYLKSPPTVLPPPLRIDLSGRDTTDPPRHLQWWVASQTDVEGHDITQVRVRHVMHDDDGSLPTGPAFTLSRICRLSDPQRTTPH